MMQLKPCPCGAVPNSLFRKSKRPNSKYAYVSGTCCWKWTIQFPLLGKSIFSKGAEDQAIDVWNNAPRGKA